MYQILCCHGMIVVLQLLPKLKEFLTFFLILCTAVPKTQYITVSEHLYCQYLNMLVRHGTPNTQKCIKQLESIQYHGAKWVCGAECNSSNFTWTKLSSQCCTILKWCPLADRRKFQIIQTVHDILHQWSCIDFDRSFTVLSIW